ncbi:hypothetical protein SODALDRAFT_155511 [Sodiomyces alkalinus F11]|uniref:Uncharacterized protein n=1 Tax=Sodiomyces alkalinus (strain CBS 110278 / VKM F-3762 / F11) TaxID=1314773 RepID=A0A3N2PXM7_SODAK|nr:hypothetical protein SODALDRAFT_155511 [Sodiomyces alkalinus F11]ROT39247.1 hypothetical protein SODALDRAFT_155511 [Sodiomyces alkalinus F11]
MGPVSWGLSLISVELAKISLATATGRQRKRAWDSIRALLSSEILRDMVSGSCFLTSLFSFRFSFPFEVPRFLPSLLISFYSSLIFFIFLLVFGHSLGLSAVYPRLRLDFARSFVGGSLTR